MGEALDVNDMPIRAKREDALRRRAMLQSSARRRLDFGAAATVRQSLNPKPMVRHVLARHVCSLACGPLPGSLATALLPSSIHTQSGAHTLWAQQGGCTMVRAV
jgi:hypothetical protein